MSDNGKTPKGMLRILIEKDGKRHLQERATCHNLVTGESEYEWVTIPIITTEIKDIGGGWVETTTRDVNPDESRNWLDDLDI